MNVDERGDYNSSNNAPLSVIGSKNDSQLNKKIENAVKYSFKDIDSSHWPENYKLKLRYCWKIANF